MTTWTTGKVLDWAASDFKKREFDKPRLEAEVLLAHVLDCRRLDLYTGFDRPLVERELGSYRQAIARRRSGDPVAYITGHREFWSLDFIVDERVLVPRPETEILVEATLERAPERGRILEIGTGSGCIAVALASERPELEIDAVDISPDACEVAKLNIEHHALSDRVCVFNGDLFKPLPKGHTYSTIVSNPPYVPDTDYSGLSDEVKKEPRLALLAGSDGLDLIRRILDAAKTYLTPRGWLLIEIDPRQTDVLLNQIGPSALEADGEIICDLAGLERIVAWQMK